MSRVFVFLDYWNFQLGWNRRAPASKSGKPSTCDFLRLPAEAVALTDGALGARSRTPLDLVETRVYASHDPTNPKDVQNRDWMQHLLGERDGFVVRNSTRTARLEPARCRSCGHAEEVCSRCHAPYTRALEKTVDAAIIVDLLTLAWDNVFDVALLISSDHDFLPVVAALRRHGIVVANGRWTDQGTRLADACDTSIRLDTLVGALARGLR